MCLPLSVVHLLKWLSVCVCVSISQKHLKSFEDHSQQLEARNAELQNELEQKMESLLRRFESVDDKTMSSEGERVSVFYWIFPQPKLPSAPTPLKPMWYHRSLTEARGKGLEVSKFSPQRFTLADGRRQHDCFFLEKFHPRHRFSGESKFSVLHPIAELRARATEVNVFTLSRSTQLFFLVVGGWWGRGGAQKALPFAFRCLSACLLYVRLTLFHYSLNFPAAWLTMCFSRENWEYYQSIVKCTAPYCGMGHSCHQAYVQFRDTQLSGELCVQNFVPRTTFVW